MVCSCKDRCNCEEHCTCCGRRCTCSVCHRIKVCNCDIFPVCKATAADTKSDVKFCQCFQSEIEETPTHSATTFPEEVRIVTSKKKPKEHNKSSKNAITLPKTPYESTLNDSKMLISDKGQLSKLSDQKTSNNASRFGSLKLTFQRIKSRFKNFKNRKGDHSALLTVEQEREDCDEPTVETSAKERNTLCCQRTSELTNNKINNYSTENSRPLSTAGKVSFASIDQNIPASDHVKSIQFTLNNETDPGIEIPHGESTETFVDNPISRNNSFHSRQTSFTSFSNLHWSDGEDNLYETLYTCYSGKQDRKSPEDVEYVNIHFKTSDNSAREQFNVTYEPMYLPRNITHCRSTSDNDENMASLISDFQDQSLSPELHSSHSTELHSSHSSKLSFRSSSEKDTDSELSDYNTHSQVSNSEIQSYSLNESSKALISSSAPSSESSSLPENHPFSQKPLFYLSSNSSLDSISILELSLDESFDLNNSDLRDRNIMDVPNSRLVSSDLSGSLETLDIRSSYSTDSESVSSTEFLPCSYCRSITSLISDSIIPYEILE